MATDVGSSRRRGAPKQAAPSAARTIDRRGGLPSARAIVGGFLIALAAVGTYLAYTTATAPPSTTYLVAAADLEYGRILQPGDVRAVAMDLPAEVAGRTFGGNEDLAGVRLVSPVSADELVQLSDVSGAIGADLYEVVVPVEAGRTLPQGYVAGEVVDILATYGSGAEQTTLVVVRRAIVLGDSAIDGGLTGGGRILRLGLDDPDQALAVTNAADAGTIGVVRATSTGDGEEGSRTFRPDLSPGGEPGRVETQPGDVPTRGTPSQGASGAPDDPVEDDGDGADDGTVTDDPEDEG